MVVNLVSAFILGAAHHHGHDGHPAHHDHAHHHGHAHGHAHGHDHRHAHGQDLNLKSAYVHVVTDAATSVLAIVALAGSWFFGWDWLDPAMGILGALLVALWARRLLGQTAKVLLDREMDHPVVEEIRETIETSGANGEARVTDLHVWRVGRGAYSCAVSLVTQDHELSPAQVHRWLAVHEEVVHATVEIQRRPEAPSQH